MNTSPLLSDEAQALLDLFEDRAFAPSVEGLEALRDPLCAVLQRGGALEGGGVRVGVAAVSFLRRLCADYRAEAAGCPLPLDEALFARQAALGSLLIAVSGGLLQFVESGAGGSASERDAAAAHAFEAVLEVFRVAGLAASDVPEGSWRLAHRLARSTGIGTAAGQRLAPWYLRLLTLAASQPDALTGRELVWLFDFLDERLLSVADLTRSSPAATAAQWWVDLAGDAPPVAVARRPVPAEREGSSEIWSFNPRPMAQRLGECIDWVTANLTAAELAGAQDELAPEALQGAGLPPGLKVLEALALLKRLRGLWMAVPVREQPRRARHYAVQVCVGLHAMWLLGKDAARPLAGIQKWEVINESPGGLAIMSVASVRGEIESGSTLALRRDAEQPWSICIVRWARSEHPGQLELGLQIVGIGFQPVEVGFRGRAAKKLEPALALPAMEPVRRHPAMLAPAGTYASRRFVFVREGASLYIAQARALGLDMQTSRVELFQYELDPYPI